MPRPKRLLNETAELTTSPPAALPDSHVVAKVVSAAGKSLYNVSLPDTAIALLVELPSKFRNSIWLKRGSFVIVDTAAFEDRENKLGGEIVNVVREERLWRKMAWWWDRSLSLSEALMADSTQAQGVSQARSCLRRGRGRVHRRQDAPFRV